MTSEIVITVGIPGCGKSTVVKPLLAQGYTRVNRDEVGGTLSKPDAPFYNEMRRLYAQGVRSFVCDNTYCKQHHRDVLMEVAKELNLPVRVLWLQTTFEQAQVFAARRQFQRYGRVLTRDDYKLPGIKDDPNMFRPVVQYGFKNDFVEPTLAEGFASVEKVPMPTVWGPEYVNRAVILDLDGTVRVTPDEKECGYPRNPSEVIIMEGRTEVLRRKQKEGYLLLGASNQSGIARKPGHKKAVTVAQVEACIQTTLDGLKVGDFPVLFSQDAGGAPQSYWPKPHPGMGVQLIETYKLDPASCVLVGDRTTDKTFAARCGFQFAWAHDYFR